MNINNQTQLNVVSYNGHVYAKVVYDFKNDKLMINPWKTYGQCLTVPHSIENATQFRVHGLNEGNIRHCFASFRAKSYQAQNRQTVASVILSALRIKKSVPQTIAIFQLPLIKSGESLTWSSGLDCKLVFESFPWAINEKVEFRETLLEPRFLSLDFTPGNESLSAIICYKVSAGANLSIHTVASESQEPFVFLRHGRPAVA